MLGIPSHISSPQVLNSYILDVEAYVVSRQGSLESLVVHLYGLHLSGQLGW